MLTETTTVLTIRKRSSSTPVSIQGATSTGEEALQIDSGLWRTMTITNNGTLSGAGAGCRWQRRWRCVSRQ